MSEKKEDPRSGQAGGKEELFLGLPVRLFDGYDGEGEPSKDMLARLLEGAPNELKVRIQERAKQSPRGPSEPEEK